MIKRVKGGITKHYCDWCGKLVYDDIPTDETMQVFGKVMTVYKLKDHVKDPVRHGGKIFCGNECFRLYLNEHKRKKQL